jgi:hypothetical protein
MPRLAIKNTPSSGSALTVSLTSTSFPERFRLPRTGRASSGRGRPPGGIDREISETTKHGPHDEDPYGLGDPRQRSLHDVGNLAVLGVDETQDFCRVHLV